MSAALNVLAIGAAGLVSAVSVLLLGSPRAGGGRGHGPGRAHLAPEGFGVLAGLLLASSFSAPLGTVEVKAAMVAFTAGTAGALIERRTLPRWAGLPLVALAGGALVALGIRSSAVGLEGVDAVVTVVWVVLVTAAVQRLDDFPGGAAAVSVPAAAGLAVLAALAGQADLALVTGGLAAALTGASIAGRRPPRARLGPSGATATGVALSAATVLVQPATEPPLGAVLPLVMLALPLFGLLVFVSGRLHHGVPLPGRGEDGLVGRLRRRGLGSRGALLKLLLAQVLVATATVAADRRWIAPGVGLGSALALSLVVAGAAATAEVHAPAVGRPVLRSVALGAVAASAAAFIAAGASVVFALDSADSGVAAVERGLAAARDGRFDDAAAAFLDAEGDFDRAGRRLGDPAVSVARLVPVLGPNLAAARELVESGASVAAAGAGVARAAPAQLEVRDGVVPVAAIGASAPALARAAATLQSEQAVLAAIERAYLVGPLRRAMGELEGRLARATISAEMAAMAAEVVPAIFGADGPRRYFVAVQNNAELRATGGLIGNFGELVADGGRVRLERFERIGALIERGADVWPIDAGPEFLARYERFDVDRTWQSVNLSPDFPTVGRVITSAYPASGGRPVDGVIAIDPVGLAALLSITGPVEVAGWPVPLSAHNVVSVTLHDVYQDLEKGDRVDLLGDVARATMGALTDGQLGTPTTIGDALGPAVRGGHLMVYLSRPEEQSLAERLDVAWASPEVESDAVLVVNQNAGASKIDYFLSRRVGYDVRLSPSGDGSVAVEGTLTVAMENAAPAAGLDPYVIGPSLDDVTAGTNRTYVSIYTPHGVTAATLDGAPLEVESELELGRSVYSAFVDVPSGATRQVSLDLVGDAALTEGGWYELELGRQPLLHPDDVAVAVTVAPGWRITASQGGFDVEPGGRQATLRAVLTEPTRPRLRLEPLR
ncbi:MAG: DUF4012 domain-containing protein [Acidimicrobiia bacterium]|nr:DUF4012 domain-containing protein [Acidimicrobiia bacterium]